MRLKHYKLIVNTSKLPVKQKITSYGKSVGAYLRSRLKMKYWGLFYAPPPSRINIDDIDFITFYLYNFNHVPFYWLILVTETHMTCDAGSVSLIEMIFFQILHHQAADN